ncbi:MAG TPA: DUF3857 and transglutaminase domain-containing protein, partial [Pyrinomonadaceae bacterium]|nr:DUF3857 and transglutaminase domain-containing protein [Pyrinomonadaceae bacterium]
MKPPRPLFRLCLLVCIVTASAASALAGDSSWKPVDPAHLAMKSPVVDPDADAEAIFWEVRVSHEASGGEPGTQLDHYIRIKVFTERGRESQSRIDIPFAKLFGRETRIKDIAARTIRPDGTVVELKKEDIFEREIVKASGLKIKAKTFAMPAVEPGAIIEYRWRESRGDAVAQYERFEFSRDIPVQLVKYSVKPSNDFVLGMRIQVFQGEPTPFKKESGFYSTTMSNVPAFREEPRMPPEWAVRPWMLVFYAEDRKLTPDKFWAQYGKEQYEIHKGMMKVNDEIKSAAAEAVAGATTDEEKLDRIFNYVRSKVRKTDDDASGFTRTQLEKMKENKTPADTLKRGVGDWHDIDMLFAAMATAAGYEARVAKLTDRSDTFFDPSFTDEYFMRYGGTEN